MRLKDDCTACIQTYFLYSWFIPSSTFVFFQHYLTDPQKTIFKTKNRKILLSEVFWIVTDPLYGYVAYTGPTFKWLEQAVHIQTKLDKTRQN